MDAVAPSPTPPRNSPSTINPMMTSDSDAPHHEAPSSRADNGTTTVEIVSVIDDDDVDVVSLYPTPASLSIFGKGTNKSDAISVEKYFEDRDLHRAIMASLLSPQVPSPSSSSISSSAGSSCFNYKTRKRSVSVINIPELDDDVHVLAYDSLTPLISHKIRKRKPLIHDASSSSSIGSFMCEICAEHKPYIEAFLIAGCTHNYCSDCMIKYVASKLQENIVQIRCPVSGCKGLLEPEHCRSILPPEVFDRWGKALCEAVILASEKFYCPFKDCSVLLVDDSQASGGGGGGGGGEVITQSVCPYCRRLFCAQCKVPWHCGIDCAEFQKLSKDEREREDILLMQLAKDNRWMRCPKCRFYVDKSEGCLFMKCRCGYTFCYKCGAFLINHYCSACKT